MGFRGFLGGLLWDPDGGYAGTTPLQDGLGPALPGPKTASGTAGQLGTTLVVPLEKPELEAVAVGPQALAVALVQGTMLGWPPHPRARDGGAAQQGLEQRRALRRWGLPGCPPIHPASSNPLGSAP